MDRGSAKASQARQKPAIIVDEATNDVSGGVVNLQSDD